ncbi:M1 family metallopeptidase [Pseudobacter ginsenosidimutans]|uniref:Peptidase M1 membrane alanine aminopeptidase domain-containing protein n=2 Tax=Pseudobacter ginsenosidimutans TaxID=661488 RepID=A0A4V2F1W6_9BACT|nr:M1 family metallopeptidase [Pseudobacter ginsenosidimutans]RZS75206.1 hypothetical protein EV199_1068 [Pseudobacter ginsenosidimutans]
MRTNGLFLPLLILCCIGFSTIQAQNLYMPADIRKAYEKGTRSKDGMPGKNYWQNKARYNIEIIANPPDRNIRGSEEIVYINSSPDTIRKPELKIFVNSHRPTVPREKDYSPDYNTTGVKIESLLINGKPYTGSLESLEYTSNSLNLATPLMPGDSMRLSIKWQYPLSVQSDREGAIDPTTFFLAYFYPRIAVYDDYNGWDRQDFTEGHEFYSDFNDYTVTVKVPKNFVVWGTGTLHQPETLLQERFADRYKRSMTSDEVIRIASKDEMAGKKVTAQNEQNSWRFTATAIPDMTFAISDHYTWDASSVIVDPLTQRRASVQAAFNDTAADYHHMVRFAGDALKWFSNNWPGIPYPYEKMTVFQGYAGMEYPMMANDETYEDTVFSRLVAAHEIAHTWMPFYMGINETRFGFMDEGWATLFEYLSGPPFYGQEMADELFKGFRVTGWTKDRSGDMDIPIITPGTSLTGKALGNNQYGKAALAYLALKDLLGDAQFRKCLHAYMDRWHGKHPIPWDFFYTFNNVNEKSLDWFWQNWFFSTNYMDLELTQVIRKPKGSEVHISNPGGMAIPFDLIVTYVDGSVEKRHLTPAIWEADNKRIVLTVNNKKAVKSALIDGGVFLDANPANNSYTAQ